MKFLGILLVISFALSSCAPATSTPNPVTPLPLSTKTSSSISTSEPPLVNQINMESSLPCNSESTTHPYLFLDCSDIARMRVAYQRNDEGFIEYWNLMLPKLPNLLQIKTLAYNPDASYGIIWNGSGNYVQRDAAIAFLVTGEENYFQLILDLLNLVHNNTPNVEHLVDYEKMMPDGNEHAGGMLSHPQFGAVVFQYALFSYLVIRDQPLLSPDQRSEFDAFFKKQAELLEEAAIFRGNDHPIDSKLNRNVPGGANIGALTIAAAFHDDPEMQALYERVYPIYAWQLGNWWEEDGGWGENTESYGFRVLHEILILAETAQKNIGEDLYKKSYNNRDIHLLCGFYRSVLTPEGSTPALNDTTHYFVDPGLLRLCAYRYSDSTLLFASDQYLRGRQSSYGKDSLSWDPPTWMLISYGLGDLTPSQPEFTSVNLPAYGASILRENWTESSQYGLLQYTQSKSHYEDAFGTFYLWDNGPWMVGNGYNIPAAKPTNQHSTLSFDNFSQNNSAGESLVFSSTLPDLKAAVVTGTPFTQMKHSRSMLWLPDEHTWLIIDDIEANKKTHTLQLRWYVRGFTYKHNENQWIYKRVQNPDLLTITMFPQTEAQYSQINRNYDMEEWVSNAMGVEMDTSYGGVPTRLVTAVTSTSGSTAPALTREDFSGGTKIAFVSSNISYDCYLPLIGYETISSETISLQGIAACASGVYPEITRVLLIEGTSIAIQNITFFKSEIPASIEINYPDKMITIESTKNVESLEVYWPQPVSSINENGIGIPFAQNGNTIIFSLSEGVHTLQIQN